MLRFFLIAATICLTFGCAEKPLDADKGRKVAEELINRTYAGQLDGIEDLYTAAFNASEPADMKKDKLTRLKFTLGDIEKMEFLSSTQIAEFGMEQQLELKYRIHHKRATTIETITVMEDEGGYKVSAHSVETER